MFSEMLAAIQSNRMPDPGTLRKRFDFAMTKKLGILKLPPAYWMRDPKINPRADHLFWAALLLKDRERIDLSLSVIVAELEETKPSKSGENRVQDDKQAQKLVEELLEQFSDVKVRKQLVQDLRQLVPEMLVSTV